MTGSIDERRPAHSNATRTRSATSVCEKGVSFTMGKLASSVNSDEPVTSCATYFGASAISDAVYQRRGKTRTERLSINGTKRTAVPFGTEIGSYAGFDGFIWKVGIFRDFYVRVQITSNYSVPRIKKIGGKGRDLFSFNAVTKQFAQSEREKGRIFQYP